MRRFHQSLFPEDEIQQLRVAALKRLSAAEVYELRYSRPSTGGRSPRTAGPRSQRVAACVDRSCFGGYLGHSG